MTRDWPTATELKALKRSDPDRCVAALASIEERCGTAADARTIASWILDEHTADRQELQKGEVLWMRYPDPEDPDFGALAPTDIARLGADSCHDAMLSNRDIVRRGLQAAGLVMPSIYQRGDGR